MLIMQEIFKIYLLYSLTVSQCQQEDINCDDKAVNYEELKSVMSQSCDNMNGSNYDKLTETSSEHMHVNILTDKPKKDVFRKINYIVSWLLAAWL